MAMTARHARIETGKGPITIELYPDEAPGTVANFAKLAESGFYNGLTFHRVIPNFVVQGGCPRGDGTGGPGYTIKCETEGNPHKHLRGSLSMAHAGKDTGGSQFFICHAPQPHLDGVHTVFGRVTDGLPVVDAIRAGDRMETVTVSE
jgi:peptidyl-prolyl cis-trans isomerase B (cyclophilin B)